jgi:hypothetical protein
MRRAQKFEGEITSLLISHQCGLVLFQVLIFNSYVMKRNDHYCLPRLT